MKMSHSTIVLLCVIALAVSIFLSFRFNFNLGVLSFLFAFLIGNILCGNSINSILAYWPYKVLFTLMAIPLFFGYASQNGTVQIIADNLLYCFRNASWASPIAIYIVALIVSTLGAGNYATVTFIGPIAFSVCAAAELNPLMTIGILIAANLGGAQYWSGGAATTASLIENAGATSEVANRLGTITAFDQVPQGLVLMLIIYFVLRGWKAKPLQIEKPAKPNRQQTTTLILIGCVVGIAILSMVLKTLFPNPVTKWMGNYLDVRILCLLASVICATLKLGDEKKIIRSLPWNTMFMITGVGLLMGIAQANGLSNILATWITGNVPTWLIPTAFVAIAGLMSFFSSALSVVYPVLMPIGLALCEANPALDLCEIMTAIVAGGALTGVSPFSTGGSMLLATCEDEKVRDAMVPKQFLFTFVILGSACVLTLIGMLKIFRY